MRKVFIPLTFVLLWAVWYFGFPYMLIWLEGSGFFSALPDTAGINYRLPQEICGYLGAYLLQFYAWPALGAAIQSLLPVMFLGNVVLIIRRLFKKSGSLTWIAFPVLPLFVFYQTEDITLSISVSLIAISMAAVFVVWLLTMRKNKFISLPSFFHSKYVSIVVFVVSAGAAIAIICDEDSMFSTYEDIAHLEYQAERGQWEQILDDVTPYEAVRDSYKKKYALLALVHTGELTEKAFVYGLSSSDDFLFKDTRRSFDINFNILFYKSLGMHNAAVYNIYQQATQPVSGMTFDAMRGLADIYLEIGDYRLARKYMDILSHSSCHGKWLKERRARLETIKDAVPEYSYSGDRYTLESFLPDISEMVDRNRADRRFADLLLCGVLADRDGGRFYTLFQIISKTQYPEGKNMPSLYQEALLLIAGQDQSLLQKYTFDRKVWDSFVSFNNMVREGKAAEAKSKYSETYWSYVQK